MDFDWEKFEEDLAHAIEAAAEETDEELSSQISSMTRMTDAEVKELFPKKSDAKKLAQLMKIVSSAESQNQKIKKLEANSKELAGVILTLIAKFV